jgi:hypothetical protein
MGSFKAGEVAAEIGAISRISKLRKIFQNESRRIGPKKVTVTCVEQASRIMVIIALLIRAATSWGTFDSKCDAAAALPPEIVNAGVAAAACETQPSKSRLSLAAGQDPHSLEFTPGKGGRQNSRG